MDTWFKILLIFVIRFSGQNYQYSCLRRTDLGSWQRDMRADQALLFKIYIVYNFSGRKADYEGHFEIFFYPF